ncbi:MAG: long-chain fatty acid--CoA ligase [Thermoplasmata archaeon]|nr:long-chain fatty acid--CoA ligase [Thermoplasmata archaeon]
MISPPSPDERPRPWLAHYPDYVPRQLTIPDVSLPDLIAGSVARWPDRAALIFYGRRWTYREFWELTGRVAAGLYRDGFRPRDRLALYLPNCPAYPIAFFGALRLGLEVVQVSPLYLGNDLEGLLVDSQPKGIVTLAMLFPHLAALDPSKRPKIAYVARMKEFYPFPKSLFVNLVMRRKGYVTAWPTDPTVREWRQLLATDGPRPAVTIDPARDVAVLQYTGGTTGLPKAAMLSHRNLVANALQCQAWFGIQPPGTGTVLATVPFFHVYGMTVALNFPLVDGATVVMQVRPDLEEALGLIDKYRPTELPGVPALYAGLLKQPTLAQHDIRSIQVCVSGSAPLPREVADAFEAKTGGYLIEGYGLSEASPVTHANPIRGERRAGTIGLPLPLTDHRIVDRESGTRELGPGEEGELAVRGPQVMLGYLGRPEETAAVLRDGWLLTGDIGVLDADGYARIVDRKKDIIDVGGFKVVPREVEELLLQHPAVAEAAVTGVEDPRLGEVVHAFVVRKPGASATEAELIEFVRSKIAHYKAPRRIWFRESLPRTAVLKVLRRELRRQASESLRNPGS